MDPDADPFDSLLNLEEDFHAEGYAQGFSDGSRQSRLESRLFGIEKGFDKFVAMGKLHAKARLLAARLPAQALDNSKPSTDPVLPATTPVSRLPPLPSNARLVKHIQTLVALTDLSTLSPANTDDAVAEFDDRLKRAQAKEKVIERIVGEAGTAPVIQGRATHGSGDMESFGIK